MISALLAAGGLGALGLSLVPRALATEGRVIASLAAALLLAAGAALPPRAGPRADRIAIARAFLLMLILLTPVWALNSVVATLRLELGIVHPLTLLAALAFDGVPMIAVGLLSRRPIDVRSGSLGEALLVLASAGLALGVLEAAARLSGAGAPGPPATRRYVGGASHVLREDGTEFYTMRPGARWGHQYPSNDRSYFDSENSIWYTTNAAGFRDAEFTKEKAPETVRVALLGDSFSFGEGVKDGDKLDVDLERELGRSAACRVEVYNFSVPGYGTREEAELLERTMLDYEPDVVVIWYFLNDTGYVGTMGFLGAEHPALFFPLARQHSALARVIGARLDAPLRTRALLNAYRETYDPGGARWRGVVESLNRMGDAGKARHLPIVMFVHPILYRLGVTYPFSDLHQRVLQAARAAGLKAYDLLPPFLGSSAEDLWVHPTDQHPNEVAQRIASVYAAEKLRPLTKTCP